MRIYTKAGDLAFSTFTFPDGQPHFRLDTYDKDFTSVTIETAITNPADLFMVLLANDVLRQHGYAVVNLDIRYLLGARMDRAISTQEPFTLQTVARLVNGAGFGKVRILDVHSDAALRLIRNSENVLPLGAVLQAANTTAVPNIIVPDKGATERVQTMCKWANYIVYCTKERDMATGNLSNFRIQNGHERIKDNMCLIVDDICDGGGTFLGLARELRAHGARKVFLYVTHGIFSKGSLDPKLIDHVYTTNSYRDDQSGLSNITTIPVSMEKL